MPYGPRWCHNFIRKEERDYRVSGCGIEEMFSGFFDYHKRDFEQNMFSRLNDLRNWIADDLLTRRMSKECYSFFNNDLDKLDSIHNLSYEELLGLYIYFLPRTIQITEDYIDRFKDYALRSALLVGNG